MATETGLRLVQKLSQQLVMTPQLRMAIKILQLARVELENLVSEELSQNPVLEEDLGNSVGDGEPTVDGAVKTAADEWKPAEADGAEVREASSLGEIDWKDYLENYGNDFHGSGVGAARDYDEERRPSIENTLSKPVSLADHLMWQLRLSSMTEREQMIAAVIINNLDGDGYVRAPLAELAFMAAADIDETEAVLKKIQEFDPPGVAARTISECLLIQLRQLGLGESVAARLVEHHLEDLEARRFDKLARSLKVSVEEIVQAARAISALEPKPGRDYGEGETRYVTPDVFVHKVGDEFVVTLNDDGMPRLRVSQFYRRMLGNDGPGEARGYIEDKMRAAAWLIKSIHQRQRTLQLVTESIVRFQRAFLEKGVAYLRPLVLKQVADDIGMHESTVSRATANKYVHTPQGIFELKYFFTSSLKCKDGDDVSAESVKKRIRELIASEDRRKPYSDQHIAELLAKESIAIARRTVAKYRELMGILPSSKRKQIY